MTFALDRRTFIGGSTVAAGGLAVGIWLPPAGPASAQASGAAPDEITAWVVIKPDDTVVIRIARSEMGQGSLTGLAQLVAEELECDWSRVTTEYPTPGANLARNRIWGSFATGGSTSIRLSRDYVRRGGAIARMLLLQAAAVEWNTAAAECTIASGVITHQPTGRTTTYGKVATAAARLTPPTEVALKDPKTWKIAGKPLKRLDTAAKLTGAQRYGIDLRLPGMLNAAIRDCPVAGGKLKSFDAAAIQDKPGVRKIVRVGGSAVAVVADTWWRARTALEALPIQWDDGPNGKLSSADIAALLKDGLDAREAFIGNQSGDARAVISSAARRVEAVYSYPFQNQATMEPMNATARWTPERCEVWAPTQNGEVALTAAAESAGLPASKCDVYKQLLGGGFGRRRQTDYIQQAVAIAKEMPGTPVKLVWTREEDMQHGFYHPITQCRLSAGLDEQGNISGLHMRISGQSILAWLDPQSLQNGRDPWTFQGLDPGGAEGVFGYAIRTCSSITPCATRLCDPARGAA